MTDINTDVLIIGGGVAGSAAAYALSKRGYEVLLLEKSEKPHGVSLIFPIIKLRNPF